MHTPVIISQTTKKLRIAELLAGHQFTPTDYEYVNSITPEEIGKWLNNNSFKQAVFINQKRLDHINKYNVVINALTGTSTENPLIISCLDSSDSNAHDSKKIINRSLKTYSSKVNQETVKKAIAISVVAGPVVASRILGIELAQIKSWLQSQEGNLAEYRDEVLNRVVSKSFDLMDTYLAALSDEDKIKKSRLSDIALAYSIVTDKAKDIVKKDWKEENLIVAQQGDVNVSEVRNIVNVLINDSAAKDSIIRSTLEKMNLFNDKPIITAHEIKQQKVLGYGDGSIDPV